jgi:hypothetical protein
MGKWEIKALQPPVLGRFTETRLAIEDHRKSATGNSPSAIVNPCRYGTLEGEVGTRKVCHFSAPSVTK